MTMHDHPIRGDNGHPPRTTGHGHLRSLTEWLRLNIADLPGRGPLVIGGRDRPFAATRELHAALR